jgi:phage I-like protein
MGNERDVATIAVALNAAVAGRLEGRRQWVHLLTPGVIQARDGRAFVMDDPKAVVDATLRRAGTTEIAVDYEHQIDLAKINGKPAPAAGWIKRFDVLASGIWGLVEWTDAAARMIAAKEYRYLSPVIRLTADLEIVDILRVALTNNPALDLVALATAQTTIDAATAAEPVGGRLVPRGTEARAVPRTRAHFLQNTFNGGGDRFAPLAASKAGREPTRERSVPMSIPAAILAALDLPDDADEAEALGVIEDLRKRAAEAAAAPATLSAMATVMTELNSDRATFRKANVEGKIEKAIRDGVITPGMREWATALCSSDEAAFDGFVKQVGKPFAHLFGASPIKPEMEARLTAERGGARAATATAEKIARQLGIDPKDLH